MCIEAVFFHDIVARIETIECNWVRPGKKGMTISSSRYEMVRNYYVG